jgi:hypothetical protein
MFQIPFRLVLKQCQAPGTAEKKILAFIGIPLRIIWLHQHGADRILAGIFVGGSHACHHDVEKIYPCKKDNHDDQGRKDTSPFRNMVSYLLMY